MLRTEPLARNMNLKNKPPVGFHLFGAFLFFGAALASLAGITLVWRGTVLDRIWTLNAPAYRQLAPFGNLIGIPFLFLGALMACAGTGWFRRRRWGWGLGVTIISIQGAGDLVNALRGEMIKGAFGFLIAGVLLIYLLRAQVRGFFDVKV